MTLGASGTSTGDASPIPKGAERFSITGGFRTRSPVWSLPCARRLLRKLPSKEGKRSKPKVPTIEGKKSALPGRANVETALYRGNKELLRREQEKRALTRLPSPLILVLMQRYPRYALFLGSLFLPEPGNGRLTHSPPPKQT